jgi:uncharacterized protein YukE
MLDGGGSSTGGDSGFEVDPATLKGAAGKLGTAYDNFLAVVSDFDSSGAFDPSLFGDVQDAWSSFDTAWANEVTTTRAAIAELIQKVSTTADAYSNTDYESEKRIRSVFDSGNFFRSVFGG